MDYLSIAPVVIGTVLGYVFVAGLAHAWIGGSNNRNDEQVVFVTVLWPVAWLAMAMIVSVRAVFHAGPRLGAALVRWRERRTRNGRLPRASIWRRS